MSDNIMRKLNGISRSNQVAIFIVTFLISTAGFLSALPEWSDGLKPGFIGATAGSLLKDILNFMMGKNSENKS